MQVDNRGVVRLMGGTITLMEREGKRLLFFTSQAEDASICNLLAAIQADLPQKMHCFFDLQRMAAWLKIPPRRFSTAVLLPANGLILAELVQLQDFFQDRKVILSLPQMDTQNIALAHRLRPVYIVTDPGELNNVVLILKKLSANGW